MSIRRIVLVTGGSNGIGLAACQLFSSQSNYHCIMGSRSVEKGEKAISSMKSSNSSSAISVVQLDINSDESIASAVEEVKSKHGHLDVLINNAGVCPVDFGRSIMRDCLETNAISPAVVTEAFAPLLLKSSNPRLIYVSSVLGSVAERTDPKNNAYEADYKVYRVSKTALNMVAACDAWQYKDKMKVFAFCPGYVVTDLADMRKAKTEEGRAGSPETPAKALLAIAEGKRDSDNAKFVHGEESGQVYRW